MNVSVLIATFGDPSWLETRKRAIRSVEHQGFHNWVIYHDPYGTVCTSRNDAAADASGDWLCFLDADDELDSGFVGSMGRAFEQAAGTDGKPDRCLFTPAVSHTSASRRRAPIFLTEKPLQDANWLVIGTLIHRDLFWEVGGFDERDPHGLEDWSLFSRADKAGARVVKVPDAVYIAHQRRRSSHMEFFQRDRANYMREYHRIRRSIHPELYDAA